MNFGRRDLLKTAGATAIGAALPSSGLSASTVGQTNGKADHTISIANGLAELAPDQIISTDLYDGQFPGPLLRFRKASR